MNCVNTSNYKIPSISWYQRTDSVVVKFSTSVPIPEDYTVKLDSHKNIEFTTADYKCAFTLSNSVKIQDIKPNGHSLTVIFNKTTNDQGFWSKLTPDLNFNRSHISIDWQNWQDEDSEDESEPNQFDFGDQQTMAAMQTLQGMDWSQLNDKADSESDTCSEDSSNDSDNGSDNESTDRKEFISESR